MLEFSKNPIEQKTDLEKINSFIDTFIVERKNLKQEFNKKELFDAVQEEWFEFLKRKNLLSKSDLEKDVKELIEMLFVRLREIKTGFAATAKMYDLLPEEEKGLECLSASMVLGSVLDKKNTNYSFISPVGHIALSVNIDGKNYYIDPSNNKIFNLDNLIKEEIQESDNFDLIKLKENSSTYSFFFKYKNKEDILQSVFGNIAVLNNLNKGKTEGASQSLNKHKIAALSLKPYLEKVDFKIIDNFRHKNYDSFYQRNKDLIAEEEKRVYNK